MTASSVYLDSSALVKLVLEEAESESLKAWIQPAMFVTTCALARTELIRSLLDAGDDAIARGRALLQVVTIVALDDDVLDSAGRLGPPALRSLDAIHLAAATGLGDDLEAIVTYDRRMVAGALALGLPVVSPGAAA